MPKVGERFNPSRVMNFVAIPIGVASRKDLSPLAKLVYGTLLQRSSYHNGSMDEPSQASMAADLGCSTRGANRAVAEDRGTSFIEGARARHCRITADGTMLRDALPEVELLVGGTDLARWRGDLDFWVFADGQVGQVDGRISGPALDLAEDALVAGLRFRMTAVDRGLPITVPPPTP